MRTQSVLMAVGQRWISTNEPELGLGKITECSKRTVSIHFPTHKTTRTYALDSAPLHRIYFTEGNTILDAQNRPHSVVSVEENPISLLKSYVCKTKIIREDDLSDTLTFSSPQERFFAGMSDDIASFSLRQTILQQRATIVSSPVRGFIGARIDLIPHQLYIAEQCTAHTPTRVLLADETGLGKTIEACLILHRMLLRGQVERVLILTPDSLVHQWFIELLRRFNLSFRLFSQEYLEESAGLNPFTDDQLWICSTDFSTNAKVTTWLKKAPWDMVIVDEAHHCQLTSSLYPLLLDLSKQCHSLILISATPEQFGREDHFARLHLLDPHRYTNFEAYDEEAQRLQLVVACIEKQLTENNRDKQSIEKPIPLSDDLRSFLMKQRTDTANNLPVPDELRLSQLIDLFGIGRVHFRNTRQTISGFPKRIANLIPLAAPYDGTGIDPRIAWLAEFSKKNPQQKRLVITATVASAIAIKDALQKRVAIDVALFHEEMTLLQRDRQAAWFSEENGAALLVCSESGSEGRNFQFCSDLVLYDLPFNPELLEQRIGRLDRIGQKNCIQIAIPFITGTPHELLARWYHEGIGIFERNVPAAAAVFEEFQTELSALLDLSEPPKEPYKKLDTLIAQACKRTAALSEELFRKRDLLLEHASNQPKEAAKLIASIRDNDMQAHTEEIMNHLFSHFGIELEDAGSNRQVLETEYLTDHLFPLPRQERPVITYDRATACARDDIEFLTIDHPMVTNSIDLFLGSPFGTTSFALWNDPTTTELLLESIYLVECIAPPELNHHRFLSPVPLRIVVNHKQEEVTAIYPEELMSEHLKNGPIDQLMTRTKLLTTTLPMLLKASDTIAQKLVKPLQQKAIEKLHNTYYAEIDRLVQLRNQGAPVPEQEITHLTRDVRRIEKHLRDTRVRQDALRLIWRGPVKGESGTTGDEDPE